MPDICYWKFGERERDVDDDWQVKVHVDDLVNVQATDLRTTMRRARTALDDNVPDIVVAHVGYDANESFDEWTTSSGVSFTLDSTTGEFMMELRVYIDEIPDDFTTGFSTRDRIAPLLSRNRMWLVGADEHDAGRIWEIVLNLGFHTRGRTMGSLVQIGLDAVALLQATAGQMTRQNVLDLLRGGNMNALIGQPEGQWLDAKRQHYDLKSPNDKIELARAVAQFANAADGGVLVIGLATTKRDGIDVINAVTPSRHEAKQRPVVRRRYVQALQQTIFPVPIGLQVDLAKVDRGDLLFIDIPPQPEELKPILVRGVVIDGEVHNWFISIVDRHEDEGLPATVETIHSMLAAGRALLRHGRLPSSHQ
ncbi:ATP-binding protein [Rhodococcus wratislaviensis]|nr:ATP-binding protein [Rhodococcus sp. 4CII]